MADFKLTSESDRDVTYAYKTDYDDLSISFDKELKCVNIHYASFVSKEPALEAQWKNETDERLKHSCKYGHWQSETVVCLSAEDIAFINKKCKELFSEEVPDGR